MGKIGSWNRLKIFFFFDLAIEEIENELGWLLVHIPTDVIRPSQKPSKNSQPVRPKSLGQRWTDYIDPYWLSLLDKGEVFVS